MVSKKVSASGSGQMIKVRYLGDAEEPILFIGPATRKEYKIGGRVNLIEVDTRDLSTGQSWAPGFFEMRGPKGEELFTVHVSLKKKAKPQDPNGEDTLPSD